MAFFYLITCVLLALITFKLDAGLCLFFISAAIYGTKLVRSKGRL